MNHVEAVAIVESNFGIRMVKVTPNEYRSIDGCPFCGSGGKGSESDRFRLILNGRSGPRVWCRQCDKVVFLDTIGELDKDELIRIRLAAVERRQTELEERQRALEMMVRSRDHLQYHENLNTHLPAVNYWLGEGINPNTIHRYKLGYCPRCPTAPFSDSYTIPVMYHGTPYNISHRLVSPNGTGKYRPHMAGLPPMLFNPDDLDRKSKIGLLLEGEKKGLVVGQETGLPNVAILGAQKFSKGWVHRFENWEQVIVCLDPDMDEKAAEYASWFDDRGYYVCLPTKADDFFKEGGRAKDFMAYLSMARRG